MIEIFGVDVYRGFSAWIDQLAVGAKKGAQPVFVGRIQWPTSDAAEDMVIKLYESNTCGVANEVIGYTANSLRGISQPKLGAILVLPLEALPQDIADLERYADPMTGLAVCWSTSLEQNTKPFSFVRRLRTFDPRQTQAFYKSKFCQMLSGVDYVTGNNDRHEGNFMYIDDFNYLAIDQGSIGGSSFWHKMWPDHSAKNELLRLVQENLTASQIASWHASCLLEYARTRDIWESVNLELSSTLDCLLEPSEIEVITEFMASRVFDTKFAASCGSLI